MRETNPQMFDLIIVWSNFFSSEYNRNFCDIVSNFKHLFEKKCSYVQKEEILKFVSVFGSCE